MKNQLVSISVRIATWFSVIKQLSIMELANDKMLFLWEENNLIKVIVWFTEIKDLVYRDQRFI